MCTALGLPPVYFRRLLQSNAATTVLDFQPASRNEGTAPVLIDRLNQVQRPQKITLTCILLHLLSACWSPCDRSPTKSNRQMLTLPAKALGANPCHSLQHLLSNKPEHIQPHLVTPRVRYARQSILLTACHVLWSVAWAAIWS